MECIRLYKAAVKGPVTYRFERFANKYQVVLSEIASETGKNLSNTGLNPVNPASNPEKKLVTKPFE